MPEEAVLDIPVDIAEPAAEPIETTVDTPETPEVDTGTPDTEVEGAEDPRVAATRPIFDPETGKLDGKLKSIIDSMKTTDPATARRLTNALMQGEALRKEIGTVKEARELKGIIEEYGGREGIQEMRGQVGDYNALSEKFEKGSPEFVQDMVTTNSEAFLTLAPTVVGKWRELDPSGSAAYLCGVFSSDMGSHQIGNHLALAERFLAKGMPEEAAESIKAIKAYVSSVETHAQQPITTPKTKAPPDGREAELSRKETELRDREWNTSLSSQHNELVRTELLRLTNGQMPSKRDLVDINELYVSNLKRKMAEDPNFKKNADRYRSAGDGEGYKRHVLSFYRKHAAEQIKYAANRILKLAPAKPNGSVNGNGAKPKPTAAKPNAGYAWRDSIPSKEERADSTTNDQLKAGWCYLKDGTKVQWKQFQKTA